MRRADAVLDDLLAAGGGLELGVGAEAAGDDHARDGALRGRAEAARSLAGGACQAEGGADG